MITKNKRSLWIKTGGICGHMVLGSFHSNNFQERVVSRIKSIDAGYEGPGIFCFIFIKI